VSDDLEKENKDKSARSATFSAPEEVKLGPAENRLGTPAVAFQSAEVPKSAPRVTEEVVEENPRRKRKGLRRKRKGDEVEVEAASEEVETSNGDEAAIEVEGEAPVTFKRRRRRRTSDSDADIASDDPPNTVVRVRKPREREVPSRSSTRLEAKRQRRRDSRDVGRRRAPILTEAEFLARREAVDRVMVVREKEDRIQIAVLEDEILVEHYVSRNQSASLIGNVYLGKVQNVLPSMEAAFIDIGRGRNGVLYAGEVNWDAAGMDGQPKRIELALHTNDKVLVQVTKDPVGQKGARLTSQISLPGRYLVFVPDGSVTGISRKLPEGERIRLKKILRDIVPEGAGVIVRTAAEGATEEQLQRDVARLQAQWENIQQQTEAAQPTSLLYSEPDLAIRVVRDIFNEDFKKLIVQGEDAWDTVEQYVTYVASDLAPRLEKWVNKEDVFTAHRIDEQLAKALDRKVYLPSGGSLVIDRTEAMTVIDVNTGKFIGQGGNLEDTVTENNLQAAEEIVRQLRLRDIGGIIVVDFIDMVLESNRDLVVRRLVECLGRDRTKHQVAEVSSLGLVQMTRKRISSGLLETFSENCEACNGRGVKVFSEPVEHKHSDRLVKPRKDDQTDTEEKTA
jgi:ribonuclease E